MNIIKPGRKQNDLASHQAIINLYYILLTTPSFFEKKLDKKLYSFYTQFSPRRNCIVYHSLPRVSPAGVARTHELFCKKARQ
ncbi:MAG: hypothetical protein ACI4GY_05350, partial [Acutalibacteraceae bacterium]